MGLENQYFSSGPYKGCESRDVSLAGGADSGVAPVSTQQPSLRTNELCDANLSSGATVYTQSRGCVTSVHTQRKPDKRA